MEQNTCGGDNSRPPSCAEKVAFSVFKYFPYGGLQLDMMRMQLEDMQAAARATLHLCKEFLALLPEEKQGNLDAFCREMACRLTVLENAAN